MLSRGELFDSLAGDLHGVPDLLADRVGWTVLDGEVGAGELLGGGVLIASRTGDSSLAKNRLINTYNYSFADLSIRYIVNIREKKETKQINNSRGLLPLVSRTRLNLSLPVDSCRFGEV